MEKGIIITGKDKAMKAFVVGTMCWGYDSSEIAIFDYKEIIEKSHQTFFSDGMCRKSTKIIVVNGFFKPLSIEQFYNHIQGEITINRLYWTPFKIHIDKLIIVCNEKLSKSEFPIDPSFTRRFEIIEL